MPPDYSIIIPAYNEEQFLPDTLESVRRSMAALPERSGEIVVTDNDSSDRTPEIARAAGAVVVFEEHRQIARARNLGGQASTGRYLIFVDADTLITPELLAKTLMALDSGRICGGGTVARFDRRRSKIYDFVLWFWTLVSRVFKLACGAYVFCLREGFEAIGGFDERYYAGEELYFSRDLKRWGRPRRLGFAILDEPIVTSGRKLDWYSRPALFRAMRHIVFRPSARRSRASCQLWYDRPDEKPPAI